MCHILSGHEGSTSLFEAVVGLWHLEELSGGGSRRPSGGADEREEKVAAEWMGQKKIAAEGVGAEKVAAAEIVGKANPEKKGGDNIGRER